jgi:glycerol uptake facilitator protein
MTGWGQVALPGVHNYVWVPIVGPIVGGVVGAIIYDLFIHTVLVDRGVPEAAGLEAEGRVVKEEADRV